MRTFFSKYFYYHQPYSRCLTGTKRYHHPLSRFYYRGMRSPFDCLDLHPFSWLLWRIWAPFSPFTPLSPTSLLQSLLLSRQEPKHMRTLPQQTVLIDLAWHTSQSKHLALGRFSESSKCLIHIFLRWFEFQLYLLFAIKSELAAL